MEYSESKCGQCHHRWSWVGFKTGIGKTPEQLAEMKKAGKVCPKCGGAAAVGLDHTSADAKAMDQALGGVVESIFGKR